MEGREREKQMERERNGEVGGKKKLMDGRK